MQKTQRVLLMESATAAPPDLSIDDLCRRLKISTATEARWRAEGRGPRFFKLGNTIRFPLKAVIDWQEANSYERSADAPIVRRRKRRRGAEVRP